MLNYHDTPYYTRIAENGYDYDKIYAYFPMFPLIMRYTALLFGGSYAVAGIVISNIFFIFVIFMMFYYISGFLSKTASVYGVLGRIFFPLSHSNSIAYTESTFLFFVLVSLIAYKKENYMISSLFCGFSMLTRITGAALLAGYGLDMLITYIKNKDFSFDSLLKLLFKGLGFLAVVTAVFGLWLVFMYAKTSDAFYFFEAQRIGWGRVKPSLFIISIIVDLLIFAFSRPALSYTSWAISTMIMLCLSIVSIKSVKKLPICFWGYSLFALIMPLTTPIYVSLFRYSMLALSAYTFVGVKSEKSKVFRNIWFTVCFILYVIAVGNMGQGRGDFI